MPARRNVRTYRSVQVEPQAQSQVQTAEVSMEEEPMRVYPHSITATPASGSCPVCCDDCQGAMLEELRCQSQLLVDLLGAVNSLTAALLCRENRD